MFDLLSCCRSRRRRVAQDSTVDRPMAENRKLAYCDEPLTTRSETVGEVIHTIKTASCTLHDLREELADIIHTAGWWDELTARYILDALTKIVQSGEEMAPAFKEAYDKVIGEAKKIKELAVEFTKEHPILVAVVCTIVVLGLLYLFLPELFALLGFGELGPIEGSFAAWWQSMLGDVPYGSIFAYLQRLGMTLG